MFKKVSLVVLVILVAFLGYVSMQDGEYEISRQMVINASPETLFPYINNTQKSNEWMPWKEIDPTVQMQYFGPEEGTGATASWQSEGQMGSGQSVVIESIPNQVVRTDLQYKKPMEMSQQAEMTLTPTAEGTMVKWSVKGKSNFMGKMMSVFFNMDKMVGDQFTKGLSNLKAIIENTN